LKKRVRILIGAGCALLLLTSWIVTISARSTAEKQIVLITQAAELINDGIYIRAVPLLEEAAGYNARHTLAAEAWLKLAYRALIDNRGFNRRYISLLESQMSRRDAEADVFAEAANHFLSRSRVPEALATLRAGITKTGCSNLAAMYENHRYAFESIRTSYEYVSEIYNGTVQVQRDGLWGIARANGVALIPSEYEKVSTFSSDRAIVIKDGEIFAVDRGNNRIALLRERAEDIGNFTDSRISLLIEGSWRRANGDFQVGNAEFEQLGTYSGGYAAAKIGGRWGVIDRGTNWLVPPEYDGVIMDGLGRSYAQGAIFVVSGDEVFMIFDGQKIGGPYEDARPFSREGYAAAKRNGKWGFIDTNGVEVIGFVFDDALSFGQHLAAVKVGESWGYISRYGQIVIEPQFAAARSFSNGSAPVLTERGWQIITLLEYK